MHRLTGLDAGFLYMETPTLHMHTLKIAVMDPSTVPGGYSFDRVKAELADRLHLLPPFRWRLVEVPLRLNHPLFVEDPDFDLDRHVHRVQVAPPGGLGEFAAVISDVAGRPLDRSKPLWEVCVVEGLEDGHVGFVSKIHHAVADGVTAAEYLVNVLDPSPDATPAPPAREWRPDAIPGRRDLLVQALRALPAQFRTVPGLLRRTSRGFQAVTRRRRSAPVSPPLPFSTPRTPFNRALTPNRRFALTSLSLDDVKRVKTALGVTVNDVILAVCAGALRRYLADRGELPDRPLVAGVPVSTRAEREATAPVRGNVVSNMFTALRTDIADPVERLRAISTVTKAAKEVHQALGPTMLEEWSELTPPPLFAGWMRLYSRLRLANRHRPPINLVVSNVPGPATPLYVAGSRLLAIYSMGPILEGIGLNITVWSYLDQMHVGAVACPEAMPDVDTLVAHLHDALEELVKAAAAPGAA